MEGTTSPIDEGMNDGVVAWGAETLLGIFGVEGNQDLFAGDKSLRDGISPEEWKVALVWR